MECRFNIVEHLDIRYWHIELSTTSYLVGYGVNLEIESDLIWNYEGDEPILGVIRFLDSEGEYLTEEILYEKEEVLLKPEGAKYITLYIAKPDSSEFPLTDVIDKYKPQLWEEIVYPETENLKSYRPNFEVSSRVVESEEFTKLYRRFERDLRNVKLNKYNEE